MRRVVIPKIGFVDAWRNQARTLLLEGVPPADVHWTQPDEDVDLFEVLASQPVRLQPVEKPTVPATFLPLAEAALCHSGPERFSLPYKLLWRLQRDNTLLADRSDIDVAGMHAMEKSIRRDAHKMKAFVRFRDIGATDSGRRQFIAWFEPDHAIIERTAPFFARRFADMDWLIVSPGYAARFKDGHLDVQLCDRRPDLPDDAADDLWRTYYASIFNPARLKVKAMKSEMPVKYWKNLPEARLIPELIANAEKSVQAMHATMPTIPHVRVQRIVSRLAHPVLNSSEAIPETLEDARRQASRCTRCDLCKYATQTVFGEGDVGSSVMFVGEQPGDIEDLSGRPFTGPAGQLFNTVLSEAGFDRRDSYVTNAVKHFKFEPRGKRRIHKRPDAGEVVRCRWWLNLERQFVKPKLIVALGATAALAVTGRGTEVLKRRGNVEVADDGVTPVLITIHPAAILRAGSTADQVQARTAFSRDLKTLTQRIVAG